MTRDEAYQAVHGLCSKIDDLDLRVAIELAVIKYGSACAVSAIEEMGAAWHQSIQRLFPAKEAPANG